MKTTKCKKHPKYRGIRKPQARRDGICTTCWDVWADAVEGRRPKVVSKPWYIRLLGRFFPPPTNREPRGV